MSASQSTTRTLRLIDDRPRKRDWTWLGSMVAVVAAIIALIGTVLTVRADSENTRRSIDGQTQSAREATQGQAKNAREAFTRDQQRSAFSDFVTAAYDIERAIDPLRVSMRNADGGPPDCAVIQSVYRDSHDRIWKLTQAHANMQVYLPESTLYISVPLFWYYAQLDMVLWTMDRESRSQAVTQTSPAGLAWRFRIDWLGDHEYKQLAKPSGDLDGRHSGSVSYALLDLTTSARKEFGASVEPR